LSRMLDAGHSSALDIDAWQHSSSITFTTHVVDQGPHAIRGVDDHSARNAGSVVSGALRSCHCTTAVELQESTRACGPGAEGARAEGVGV